MSDRNERVRALFQEGDPAAGDPGLSLDEVQAMRRTVLTAVPEPQRRGWLVPALAGAAVVLAVLIVFNMPQMGTVEVASKPSRPLPRTAANQRVVVPLSQGAERGGGRGDRGVGHRQPPPAPPDPEPRDPEPVIAEGSQQIQFSTPGGTRVIWMLNPATE